MGVGEVRRPFFGKNRRIGERYRRGALFPKKLATLRREWVVWRRPGWEGAALCV